MPNPFGQPSLSYHSPIPLLTILAARQPRQRLAWSQCNWRNPVGVDKYKINDQWRCSGGRDHQDPKVPSPGPPTPFPSSLFMPDEEIGKPKKTC